MSTHRDHQRIQRPAMGIGIGMPIAQLFLAGVGLAAGGIDAPPPRPGSLDEAFRPGFTLAEGESVGAVARDSLGRWLIGKGPKVLRLAPSGILDETFAAGAEADGTILGLAVDAEGGIYVGGAFAHFAEARSPGLVRLGEDGERDIFEIGSGPVLVSGHPGRVAGLALQQDGGILVAGDFATWNGQRAPSVTRIQPNGGMDREFTENLRPIFGGETRYTVTTTNVNGESVSVTNVTVSYERLSKSGSMGPIIALPTGGCVVGGVVHAQLASDGVPVAAYPEASGAVWGLSSNDEILAASTFRSWGRMSSVRLRRWKLGADPRVTWETNLASDGTVRAIAEDSSGRAILGGDFTTLAGHRCQGLARLNPDGTVDAGFSARIELEDGESWEYVDPANWLTDRAAVVSGIRLDADGSILVHGRFNRVDGVDAPGLARLHGGNWRPHRRALCPG